MKKLFLIISILISLSVSSQTFDLETFYSAQTSNRWNVVLDRAPQPNAPTFIGVLGAGTVGTDTSLLTGFESPLYYRRRGWNGTVFGERVNIAVIQSRNGAVTTGPPHFANYIDSVIAMLGNVDTNRIYVFGVSRGAADLFFKSRADVITGRWWQATAATMLSIGASTSITDNRYDVWLLNGGRMFATIGTVSDSSTYSITMNYKRRADVYAPNTVAVYIRNGGGHNDWQTEWDPNQYRINGYNLYENAMTVSKKPYAYTPFKTQNLPNGTTSSSLTASISPYSTPQSFMGRSPTYAWSVVSGPGGTSFTNGNTPNATINGLTTGTYVVRFTSTNAAGGQSAYDDITINVAAPGTGTPFRPRLRIQ